jgi:hypothetical protein
MMALDRIGREINASAMARVVRHPAVVSYLAVVDAIGALRGRSAEGLLLGELRVLVAEDLLAAARRRPARAPRTDVHAAQVLWAELQRVPWRRPHEGWTAAMHDRGFDVEPKEPR